MQDARDRQARTDRSRAVTVESLLRSVVARGGTAALRLADRGLLAAGGVVDLDALPTGQVVTLLAPIAETLGIVHGQGWAHGALSRDSLALSDRRMPVLVDWRSARAIQGDLLASGRDRWEKRDARRDDLESLRDLTRELLAGSGCTPSEIERVTHASIAAGESGARALAEALFTVAEPLPLSTDETGRTGSTRDAHPADRAASTPAGSHVRRRDDDADAPSPRSKLRLVGAVRRRPLVVAAGAICLIATAAVLVLPAPGDAGGSPETPGGVSGLPTAAPEASTSHSGTESSADEAAEAEEPSADDPLGAAVALLTSRNACVAADDPVCLAALYAASAPGLDVELSMLEHPSGGVEVAPRACELTDRTGQIALVTCSTDTSTCLVTVEWGGTGWRLRAVRADQMA